MNEYDVYGIGNALLDMVVTIDDDFVSKAGIQKGTMTLIDKDKHDELLAHVKIQKKAAGGSAANALIMLCHLGGRGFYSCKVADDEAGRFYVEGLTRSGLNTNLKLEALKDGVTGKCLVMITPDAERTMCTYLGATETFSVSELVPDAIAKSKYIYIEGYLVAQKTGLIAAVEGVKIARKYGVKTSLTFSDVNMINYFRGGMNEIVGDGIDLIFCNEKEAMTFTQTEDLSQACEGLKRVCTSFAVTRGEKGALIYDGIDLVDIPTKSVRAIDTVGAGDMFAGTFLYSITHGRSFREAGVLANHAASTVVTQYGPRLSKEKAKQLIKESTVRQGLPAR